MKRREFATMLAAAVAGMLTTTSAGFGAAKQMHEASSVSRSCKSSCTHKCHGVDRSCKSSCSHKCHSVDRSCKASCTHKCHGVD